MANKKHTQMNITFQVSFATPLNDDEVTDVMKELDLDLKHPLVNSIELRKLTK